MYLRVIEGEEVREDDPIECFLPTGVELFLSHRGVDGN